METDNHEEQTAVLNNPNGEFRAMSPAAFEHRITNLETELRDLKVRLIGDPDAEERYAENRRTYVTPNIPKPEPGVLTMLRQHVTDQDDAFTKATKLLIMRVEKLEQLRAFFEPMLANKTPPLDGALIVDRAQLDDALSRLAGALREEMSEAKHFVDQVERVFREVLPRELVQLDRNHSPTDRKSSRLQRLGHIATYVRYAYDRVIAIDAERGRPSRLKLAKAMLRTIVTGKEADQP